MRAPSSVRTALVSLLSLLAFASAGCKARTPAQSAVKADEQGEGVSDAAVKAEVAEVSKACENAPGASYQGIGDDGAVIEFTNSPRVEKKGESGQKPWNEEARFNGKVWVLTATIHGREGAPECLRSSKLMTTRLLIAALGCSSDVSCETEKAVCSGADCPTTLAQVDFKRNPTELPTVGGPTEGIALTDDPAGPTTRCEGTVLKTAAGTAIGVPFDTPEECEILRATEHHDLVCAWGGLAFLPARAKDGVLIGDAKGGFKEPGQCEAAVVMGSHGAVCSWSGSGLAPFGVASPTAPIGASDQYSELMHCIGKTSAAVGGRLCAWDGKAVAIFAIPSRQPARELGTFNDYESCYSALRQVAKQGGEQQFQGLAERAKAPPPAAKGEKDGPGGGAMNLAGGGWTWGECNDSARAFHLVGRSGSRMICEGRIDTLYSWGPEAKISWLLGQPWSGRIQRGGDEKEIFASQSAFATFGYGPYAIRIKLKSNAQFRFFDNVAAYGICDSMSASEVDTTVAVRYWNIGQYTGLDFILCGLGPVHSYSYGTQGHYDEMSREVTWMAANNMRNYELYVKTNSSDVTYPTGLDSHAFSPQIWQNQLAWHRSWIPGHVIFNPSVSDKTSAAHFETAWPTYINPGNGAPAGNQPQLDTGAGGGAGGGSGKKWYLLNFATQSQADRNQNTLEMNVVLNSARQKGVVITCQDANPGGWAVQKQCLVDAIGEAILTEIFSLLTYHQSITFWKNG